LISKEVLGALREREGIPIGRQVPGLGIEGDQPDGQMQYRAKRQDRNAIQGRPLVPTFAR
jgi:hypothetical protein